MASSARPEAARSFGDQNVYCGFVQAVELEQESWLAHYFKIQNFPSLFGFR
jgi:hypothetical protein